MKKYFKNHFKNYWFLYVVWLLVSALLSTIIINARTRLSLEKKVEIFFACKGYGDSADINDYLTNNKPYLLEKVTLSFYDYESDFFGAYYAANGIKSDVLILPEKDSIIIDKSVENYFSRIDTNAVESYFNQELYYYSVNGYTYGIKVYDYATKTGLLSSIFTGLNDDIIDYYMFFTDSSVHAKMINGIGNDNCAFEIITLLANYETI